MPCERAHPRSNALATDAAQHEAPCIRLRSLSLLATYEDIPSSVRIVNLWRAKRCPADLVQRLYALTNVGECINLYGPTEDTIYVNLALAP